MCAYKARTSVTRLGTPTNTQDFEEDYSTPEFELYEDDDGNGVPLAKECEDEPTPITYDTYIGAEVVLPKGNHLLNLNYMKVMIGMGFHIPRNVRINQLLSHMTHAFVLRYFHKRK